MPPMGDALHSLSACFEDRVELGALLDHLPSSLEAGRYHEPFAGAEFGNHAGFGEINPIGHLTDESPRTGDDRSHLGGSLKESLEEECAHEGAAEWKTGRL